MKHNEVDFTIVGGGIIGLSIAFKLAYHLYEFAGHDTELKPLAEKLKKNTQKPPLKIVVLDQYNFTASASFQAAGILATYGATHYLSPLRKQIVESTREYPKLLAQIGEVLQDELGENTIADMVKYNPTPHYHMYADDQGEQLITKERKLRRLSREHATDWQTCSILPHVLNPFFTSATAYFNDHHHTSVLNFSSHTISPPKLLLYLKQAGEKLGVSYIHGTLKHLVSPQKSSAHTNIKYQPATADTQVPGSDITLSSKQVILATGNYTPYVLQTVKSALHRGYQGKFKELKGSLLTAELKVNTVPEFTEQKFLLHLYDKKYFWLNSHSPNSATANHQQLLFGSHDEIINPNTQIALDEENTKNKLINDLYRLLPALKKSDKKQYLGRTETSSTLNNIRLLQGSRLFTKDKQPLLGYIAHNLFLATAYYKSGLALAPLHSRFTAQLLLKKTLTELIPPENNHSYSNLPCCEEIKFLHPLREKGLTVSNSN